MKKFLLFIFAFLYLGLSSGFSFDIHFCMGKFSSVELFHSSKNKCGKCGMNAGNNCCKTKITAVKITDNQQLSTSDIKILSPFIVTSHSYAKNEVTEKYLLHITLVTDSSPPPIPGSFLCILHSVFII